MNTAALLSLHMVAVRTELGASHEVVAGLFGVFAVHFASLWIKFGEHVPVEAIVVFHEAESRCAVWHGLELFLLYSLAFKIVVVDFVPFEEDDGVVGALWMRTFHSSIQIVGDSREDFRDILGVASLQLVLVKAEHLVVQEEEHAVVVVGVVFKVHVESSVHMAQVMMVVQLSETLIGELGKAVEALV